MQQTLPKIKIDIDEAKAELCKRSFFFFLQEFWHIIIDDDFEYNWHIEYLCEELQTLNETVKNREPKLYDLIINIPPGTSKSTICTIMYPAWVWVNDPSQKFLTASYSSSLSTDHAVKSRDIIRSEKFVKYFGDLIKKDSDNKTHYQNNFNGARMVTSVGGTATGKHAHQIIIDDPINPQESDSIVLRENANRWIDRTLSTRKVDKKITPTILIMQRLHQEDPTGHLLAKSGKNIKHICLPGELSPAVTPAELKDKYTDGLLDANRLGSAVLEELKTDLGSYGYAGQIAQLPAPEGGMIWQKWFIEIEDKDFPDIKQLQSVGTDWDLAYTENEMNSASGYISAGKMGNNMYIFNIGYIYKEFPELIKSMALQQSPHYIENKGPGKSSKQTLHQMGISAIEVKLKGGDKVSRARNATPKAEAGFCYIKKSLAQKLYYDDKQGILNFPNAPGDDMQDALVQSIQRLLGKNDFFSI